MSAATIFDIERLAAAAVAQGYSPPRFQALVDQSRDRVEQALLMLLPPDDGSEDDPDAQLAEWLSVTVLQIALQDSVPAVPPGFPADCFAPHPAVDITEPLLVPAPAAMPAIVDGPNGPELGEVLAVSHWPDAPLPDVQCTAEGGAS